MLTDHILVPLLNVWYFACCMYTVSIGGYVVSLLNVSLICMSVFIQLITGLMGIFYCGREAWWCWIHVYYLHLVSFVLCWYFVFVFVLWIFGSVALGCYRLLWICYRAWSYKLLFIFLLSKYVSFCYGKFNCGNSSLCLLLVSIVLFSLFIFLGYHFADFRYCVPIMLLFCYI
jgi:hypothetical protein